MSEDSTIPGAAPHADVERAEPGPVESANARRLRRFRAPALAVGGVALMSPLGLGFAVGVTAVAAGMFFLSRRSDRAIPDQADKAPRKRLSPPP